MAQPRRARRAPVDPSWQEYQEVMAFHWEHRKERACRADAIVYKPEKGEPVRVGNLPGQKFRFVCFESDSGGDYAVVLGGLPGHRTERCVTVDRVQPYRRHLRRSYGA